LSLGASGAALAAGAVESPVALVGVGDDAGDAALGAGLGFVAGLVGCGVVGFAAGAALAVGAAGDRAVPAGTGVGAALAGGVGVSLGLETGGGLAAAVVGCCLVSSVT
jgi:hypothetical protein